MEPMGEAPRRSQGRRKRAALAAVAAWLAGPTAAHAGDAGEPDLRQMTLEELLAIPVAVVTRSERPLRDTPGIVTVITRDDLAASGARDLIAVLQLVPGFAVGMDVQGSLALGFRGNTGAGGQILVLVDGLELNENMYGTPMIDVPIDLIEKIEIVRGPGSVVHGGYAELAVINVITRAAAGATAATVGTRYGQMEDGLGYRDVFATGRDRVAGVDVGVSASLGEGRRSDGYYRDFFGGAYRLPNRVDPAMLDVGLGWHGLEVRGLGHWLRTSSQDAVNVSEPAPVDTDFASYFLDARYAWRLTDTVTLTPRATFKRQQPWQVRDLAAITYYRKTAARYTGSVTLDWAVREHLDVLAGAEAFTSRARLVDTANTGVGFQQPLAEGDHDSFSTLTAYSQVLLDHRWANLSLGARLEWNSRFGAVMVPRIGVTRGLGRLHTKLLLSQAFRAPGHEPYSLNVDLRPEKTTTYELEVGYQLGEHVFAGANLFDITTRDPFVYDFDPLVGAERYLNFPRTGSRGVEAVVRAQHERGRAQLTGSYYDASGKNQVALYAVPGQDDVTSGFPAWKLTLSGSARVAEHLSLSPSVVVLGPVWGPVGVEGSADDLTFGEQDATLLLGIYALRRDLAVPGLDLGIGVADLLDQGVRYVERSAIAHAPLPGPTREYMLHVSYRRPLD